MLLLNPIPFKGRSYSIPNLGLIYLISYYKKYGKYPKEVQFKIYDENWQNVTDLKKLLQKFKPQIVGLSSTSLTVDHAEELIKMVRDYDETILVLGGGIHFQVDPEGKTKSLDLDVLFTGEGEIPFQQLLDIYFKNKGKLLDKSLSRIAGIAYRKDKNSDYQFNPPGKLVTSLDFLDYKDIEKYCDHKFYFQTKYELCPRTYGRILTIFFSRGCPFKCKFCFNSFCNRPIRYHSSDYFIKAIRYFQKKYGINLVRLNDDLFLSDRVRTREFCEKLIKAKLGITWVCTGRADVLREGDLELLQLVKKAGCKEVNFGFESGSDKVLKYLKGPTSTVAKNKQAIDVVHEAGLGIFGFFMVGVPGETKKDLNLTKRFIEDNLDKIDYYEIFIFTPLPGTVLWERCLKEGLLKGLTFSDLVWNMLTMDYQTFRVFTKEASKKDVYETREYLKKLVVNREPLINKIRYVMLYAMRDPKLILNKFLYYFDLRK